MKKNPKALNLELLEIAEKPVTLGFKINPETKLKLAKSASESGMSLSMYVKNILTDKYKFAKKEIEVLNKLNFELIKKINNYENPKLKNLYSRFKGKSIEYKDENGNNQSVIIKEIFDVHNIVTNSFKSI